MYCTFVDIMLCIEDLMLYIVGVMLCIVVLILYIVNLESCIVVLMSCCLIVGILRRLRDRDLLRKRKAEAEEKETKQWVYG